MKKVLLSLSIFLASCAQKEDSKKITNEDLAILIHDLSLQVTEMRQQMNELSEEQPFYVQSDDPSSVVSVDDLNIIEFEYKGKKYARFSMPGAGRGFAFPLGCGDGDDF